MSNELVLLGAATLATLVVLLIDYLQRKWEDSDLVVMASAASRLICSIPSIRSTFTAKKRIENGWKELALSPVFWISRLKKAWINMSKATRPGADVSEEDGELVVNFYVPSTALSPDSFVREVEGAQVLGLVISEYLSDRSLDHSYRYKGFSILTPSDKTENVPVKEYLLWEFERDS